MPAKGFVPPQNAFLDFSKCCLCFHRLSVTSRSRNLIFVNKIKIIIFQGYNNHIVILCLVLESYGLRTIVVVGILPWIIFPWAWSSCMNYWFFGDLGVFFPTPLTFPSNTNCYIFKMLDHRARGSYYCEQLSPCSL